MLLRAGFRIRQLTTKPPRDDGTQHLSLLPSRLGIMTIGRSWFPRALGGGTSGQNRWYLARARRARDCRPAGHGLVEPRRYAVGERRRGTRVFLQRRGRPADLLPP